MGQQAEKFVAAAACPNIVDRVCSARMEVVYTVKMAILQRY
jgi:hypothetical protein